MKTMRKNGFDDRLRLSLIEPEPFRDEAEEPIRRDERRLALVADRLADALDDCEAAVHAGADAEFGPRLKALFQELMAVQEEAARALGSAIGDRVATVNRWRVRRGIDVAEPRR